jgi:plasmid stabilization system protein ParE
MKKTRLVLTDAAIADILDQADWYLRQSGRPLAQRWD